MTDIYKILSDLNIPFTRYDHPAVFTVEEAEALCNTIPGGHIKNLFLRNRKGDKHYLIVIGVEKQVDLKKLEILLDEKLSFASPERLMHFLGVTPGSVTILGLINDINKEVVVIIDIELSKYESLDCHPLINTVTLVISQEGVANFLKWSGNEVRHISL